MKMNATEDFLWLLSAFAVSAALYSLCTMREQQQPARNELPPYIRARAIRTQGQEPAVRLQPIFVPIPEPSRAPAQRAEVRREDLA